MPAVPPVSDECGAFVVSVVSVELADDALAANVADGLARVEAALAEAARVEPAPAEGPLSHYLRVVEHKPASFIATAGRFAAMFAGAPASVVSRTTAASRALGMAFQLSDDILDVASDSAETGKSPGTDL